MEDEHPDNENKSQTAWGPVSAILVSLTAYIVSQLILFIPLIIIQILNPSDDITTTIDNSAWLQLALAGLSSIALLSVLIIFLKRRKQRLKDLGFRNLKLSDIGWIIVGLVIYYGLLIAALTLASQLPDFNLEQQQEVGYQNVIGWQLGLAFIGLVVLPPLAEEMLFRGFLYRGLASKLPKVIAALIASSLFAFVHFQWNVAIDVFILSMVMIALLEKTKNLWVCVAMHAVKNAIAFLALFVFVN